MSHPITPYLNVRTAYWPTVSADGAHLAFLSNITGSHEVWRVPLGGDAPAWPDQLTFSGDRVMGVAFSPTHPDRLLYTTDVGGNENAQINLLDGGRSVRLTAGHEGAMHLGTTWLPDGSGLLFAANRRQRARFDLYRQRLDGDGSAEMVYRHDVPGYLGELAVAPDGRSVIAVRGRSSYSADLLRISLDDGRAVRLNPHPDDARYSAPLFADAGGDSLYLLTDAGRDCVYLARLELAAGTLTPVVAPDWNVEVLAQSRDRRLLGLVVNEEGIGRLYLHDTRSGATRAAPPVDDAPGIVGYMDGRLEFAADGSALYFAYTGARRTFDVFSWQLATDVVRPLTRSSHGGLDPATFVAPELVHYPTFDGRSIPAWFYRPNTPSTRRLPVIVHVHGGPEGQYRPYFNFLAQYFVDHGYAVLAPNVRGSSGYGKLYAHLDDVHRRMDSVADLAHAAHWLRTRPDVDPARVVVYGGSYGGFMVLSAMTNYPDLWAAGVDIVGIANFVTFLENTSDYRRAHREAEYGSLARDRDFLARISPLNQIDRLQAPLFIVHGRNDPRVPVSEAEQLAAALARRGVPAELLIFNDEGHGIVKLANKQTLYPALIAFLERVLGPA